VGNTILASLTDFSAVDFTSLCQFFLHGRGQVLETVTIGGGKGGWTRGDGLQSFLASRES